MLLKILFLGGSYIEIEGTNQRTPPKKNNRGRYRITGHRTGSGEWFGFLSSGCRVLAWLRYRGPPLLLGVFWVAGPTCIKRCFFWKEGYGLLVQYPKYASMYGKLIFLYYLVIKIKGKCIGRYCTHGAFIWLLMTWNTSPTKSSWRVAVLIEMSLEDLRRWWNIFFFRFVEEPFPKQAMSRWWSLRKPQVAEPQAQNPGVFQFKMMKMSPQDVSRLEYFGVIPPYAIDYAGQI